MRIPRIETPRHGLVFESAERCKEWLDHVFENAKRSDYHVITRLEVTCDTHKAIHVLLIYKRYRRFSYHDTERRIKRLEMQVRILSHPKRRANLTAYQTFVRKQLESGATMNTIAREWRKKRSQRSNPTPEKTEGITAPRPSREGVRTKT